jgi:LAO/AO transport system kinase
MVRLANGSGLWFQEYMTDQDALIKAIRNGDRAALARAITLVESTRSDHRKEAQSLLTALLPDTGNSIRIGITGVPGVGKSTFIESFGMHVIDQGHKMSVLAIDPSSARTGGSILGDKTRMGRLAQSESAYIRPSPAAGSLGGVARRTRESMLLTEAAGYDVVVVETVGVGQSETEVADMVDIFVLLLLPGSGDELQGIKKGIVELADLMVVNKADGDQLAQAKRVRSDYSAALRMLHPSNNAGWQPKVLVCSALNNTGIDAVWDAVQQYAKTMQESGHWKKRRNQQAKAWMWKEIQESLMDRFKQHPATADRLQKLEAQVMASQMSPADAAHNLIEAYLHE